MPRKQANGQNTPPAHAGASARDPGDGVRRAQLRLRLLQGHCTRGSYVIQSALPPDRTELTYFRRAGTSKARRSSLIGSRLRDLNRPHSGPSPLPFRSVRNLDQHRGHAVSSKLVSARCSNMKFPDDRHSFTSQHPKGEPSSKGLSGHVPSSNAVCGCRSAQSSGSGWRGVSPEYEIGFNQG